MGATENGNYDYDLLVMGSGPAGQRAAIQGAKLGKRVAVIEHKAVVGGACINTGTIPSKTLREAVMHLSGYRERNVYGASYQVKQNITMEDLLYRASAVIQAELDVVRHQMQRNGVELIVADAKFAGPETVVLTGLDGRGRREVRARYVVIATGTAATRSNSIPFDGQNIIISDDILGLKKLPKSLCVIGAGVIGLEYATMFSTLGVRVTVVDKRERLLDFVDHEITDILVYQMRKNRVTLRLGEEVEGIDTVEDEEHGLRVRVKLRSGKTILTEKALYSIGRTGATHALDLPAAGLQADSRGRVTVDENYRTSVPNILAAGDVIGFPALASTSMEQGRLAACHAFGVATKSVPELFPYGIYTIPEISTCGKTEEELTQDGVPYEIGKARYQEIARGAIIGDKIGMLKLLFHVDTRKLLGVHIIGEGASELIHIGQAVMAFDGTVDYFVRTVFNYPTLAECYKTAAFDGINRLG
ncbi:MAG: Si-specific NAD(P)(+) transhydrogenase [Telmatospirillum sp.]|nr:Si-specific NAD(P)(+) transhydrogenase [Telmatospirillum sp.]